MDGIPFAVFRKLISGLASVGQTVCHTWFCPILNLEKVT